MADITADSNGRVTLAILGGKIDAVLDRLDKIDRRLDKSDDRLGRLETSDAAQNEQIENIEGQVKTWNLGNSIGSAVAIVMGLIGLGRQP